jgi:hypothetical protein
MSFAFSEARNGGGGQSRASGSEKRVCQSLWNSVRLAAINTPTFDSIEVEALALRCLREGLGLDRFHDPRTRRP